MKKIVKSFLFALVFLVLGFVGVQAQGDDTEASEPALIGKIYITNEGWKEFGVYGNTVEALKLSIENPTKDMKIRYKAYIEKKGWSDWTDDENVVGIPGSKLSILAVKIELLGNTGDYNILYKSHVQEYGWNSFSGNGEISGTENYSEGISGLIAEITDNENYNKEVSLTTNNKIKPKSKKLDVPIITQRPELPTGCEITAITMMLKYYGCNTDKIQLAREMPRHNSNPNLGYVGNPFTKNGWTINPPPLCILVKKYVGSSIDLSGSSLDKLETQIANDKPVVVWVKMHGFTVHAITLTGYDENNFYYNDPWTGEKGKMINKKSFESTWKSQNKRAISY
ncbi:MAG: C39 family peptidase [Clostridiaceae bacterium]